MPGDGLSGDRIPLPVRIVTVADIFDAMTSDRAYRDALKLETAFEILSEGVARGWWDGRVVEALRQEVAESGVLGSDDALPE